MTRNGDGGAKDSGGERFEDLVAAAEAIAKKLESGQLTLEESVAEWQRGMELLKRGEALLGSAERRVEILSRGEGPGDEAVRAEPFDADEDDGAAPESSSPRRPSPPPRPRGAS